VDNELEVIRNQMESTRSNLADKLEALEGELRGTVEGATNAVANTVETVQETVENVKESVKETVETVRETLDVRKHVERHPWAMFGGAVLLGCIAGGLLGRRRSRKTEPTPAPAFTPQAQPENGYRNGYSKKEKPAQEEEPGPLASGLQAIKGLALGTLMGTLRDVLVQAVPTNLANDLAGVVDNMTTRLGGKPLRRSEEDKTPETDAEAETHHESDYSEVGRPMGSTRWSG
jgi:ElaB/YqjD/DUF883 family membrane-anchored ribosome-binding protein